MKARVFNSGPMPRMNHQWASEILNVPLNPGRGPDLIDDGKFVELKFSLMNPKSYREKKPKNYPKAWTVLEDQVEYDSYFIGQGFWGLGLYELDRPVKEIYSYHEEALEKLVLNRELYLVRWSWMDQFPASKTSGKTDYSEWENVFRYPKLKDVPPVIETWTVKKGKVYFTEGVDPGLFRVYF